jgi:fructose-bisphosphate aldolase class II
MLVNLNKILPKACKRHYAVGAFNTSNIELTQAILKAAEMLNAPVIVATSEKAIRYAGIEAISQLVITMAKKIKIPVVLHLDHGSSVEIVRECIKNNYSSVMIDMSHMSFQDNLKITRQVVNYAHRYGVTVEAEIGRLAGIEDDIDVKSEDVIYTDPEQAELFAKRSGCDALAVAIGTSHGAYKFKGKPKLRIDILREIAKHVKIPLVLHGASSVKTQWINRVNKYGGNLEHAKGVPDLLIKQVVKHGIAKINTDTDLRIAFTAGIREYLNKQVNDFDPRKIVGYGRDMAQMVVANRIRVFGSVNKA